MGEARHNSSPPPLHEQQIKTNKSHPLPIIFDFMKNDHVCAGGVGELGVGHYACVTAGPTGCFSGAMSGA